MSTEDPVTVWIGQLAAGDREAVRPLWDRYFQRLVALARARLRTATRLVADEEDVALSAFDSFCRNAERGRFPDLTDRDSLWRLLAAFTVRKVSRYIRDAGRQKRGGGVVMEATPEPLAELLGREPPPEIAAELSEECERLLMALGAPDLQRVAILRMDGCTVDEVADHVGCAPRSVKRKLQLIRAIWEREAGDESA
jgi:DNA-directed RNA polymerase specialized sigma24 family protein